jgi:putative PEP-CTERM system TPR-repeat lipoprotein
MLPKQRHLPAGAMAMAMVCLLILAGCGKDSSTSLISSGTELLAKKEPGSAVIQFKAALQKDPSSAQARYLLGKALLDAGDPSGATLELSKAMDAQYDQTQVLPVLARALLLSGGARKLTTLYSTITLPDKLADASLKTSVANAWGVLGEFKKAQSTLAAALDEAPDYAPGVILGARVAASEGRADEALAAADRVLKADPGNYDAWQLRGEVLASSKQQTAAAIEAFSKALAAQPAYLPAHQSLVVIYVKANKLAEAKAQVEKLRAVLPRHPQTIFLQAQMALAEKDLPAANEFAQQLLRGLPDNVPVLLLAGTVSALKGELVLAEAQFGKAIQLAPETAYARRGLAKVQLRVAQPAKALQSIEPITRADSRDAEALSLAGEAQLQLGNAPAAEDFFNRAAQLAPNDPRLRTSLALLKLAHGEAVSAFQQLESISAANPTDTFTDLALVSARLKRKEYDAALAAIDVLAKKQPQSITALDLRGRVQIARKDYRAAREAFEQALVIDPAFFTATANLAAMDVQEGHREQARLRLEAAVKGNARNSRARMALADLRLQEGAPLTEVQQILADGIQANPTDPAPRLHLIELLLLKRQFKPALTVAQEASASLPGDADLTDALGRAQAQSGDTQQAISSFKKLAALEPISARAHIRLADVYKASGNKEGAAASLRRAIEIDPNVESAQTSLISMMIQDGRPKDALELARKLQARDPGAAAGYLLEGAIHRRTKQPDAAIAAYRKGLLAATSSAALAVELHRILLTTSRGPEAERFADQWLKAHPKDLVFENQLATSFMLRGQFDRAEPHFSRLAAEMPNDAMVLNNLAWLLTARGKPGGIALAQRAMDLMPNRPALMDTLAMALVLDKQLPKALELQRKAVEIAPGDMSLRFNLAKIAVQAGDKATARTELDKLAAMGTKLPFQDEVGKLMKSL